MLICRVEEVFVSERLFDEDGSLHLGRADLIAYAHGEYFPLRPRPEGFFGYSLARGEVLRRRLGTADKHPSPKKKTAAKGGKRR